MIDREHARQQLDRLFGRKPVADLTDLQRALGTSSRTSVFRILSEIGYLTSYSHAGRFYTLHDLPRFDKDGLWSYRDVLFSKFHTLRATLLRFVNDSKAGQTHSELQEKVRLRVYDTLHDLLDAHEIGRVELEQFSLYVSGQRRKARDQIARRRRLLRSQRVSPPAPDAAVVIEVLLAYIHHPGKDANSIASLLRRSAKAISVEQVQAVFAQYGLGKKKTPLRHWQP